MGVLLHLKHDYFHSSIPALRRGRELQHAKVKREKIHLG